MLKHVVDPAPYYAEVARGPSPARVGWTTARDGTRLRVGFWPQEGAKGTVLMFPGRTEYLEKYSDAALEFAQRGYASGAIDWRGQGLSDRVDAARRLGHVGDFAEYQQDVQAFVAAAEAAQMPRPFYLLAHSMGGCIGLRALHNGLPVRAVVFSAPMWDLGLAWHMRLAAWGLSHIAVPLGLGQRFAPTKDARAEPGVLPFAGNPLTSDPAMYAWLQAQVRAHPDLYLAGASLGWLRAAFREIAALRREKAPDLPALCWLGLDEQIVSVPAIQGYMARWPKGQLIEVPDARHEVLLEQPDIRQKVFDQSAAFFSQV